MSSAVDVPSAGTVKVGHLEQPPAASPFPSEEQLKTWEAEAVQALCKYSECAYGLVPLPGECRIVGRSTYAEHHVVQIWVTNYGRVSWNTGDGHPFEPLHLTMAQCKLLIALNAAIAPIHRGNAMLDDPASHALMSVISSFRKEKNLSSPAATNLEQPAHLREQHLYCSALLEQKKAALEDEKWELAEARVSLKVELARVSVEKERISAGKEELAAMRRAALALLGPLLKLVQPEVEPRDW